MENLVVLSSATRYNTERRALLRGTFDHYLRKGELFSTEISQDEISEYWAQEGIDPDDPERTFRHLVLTLPEDPDPQHYQLYLGVRYSPASEDLREKLGFSAIDLVSLEAMIYNLVSERAESLGIESDFHTFNSKSEYGEFDQIRQPTEIYQNKWSVCIEFQKSELIDEFLAEISDQQLAQTMSLEQKITLSESIISFLSTPLDQSEKYGPYQFFLTPLFEPTGRKDSIVVPFPGLLVTTAQIRIERLFQRNQELKIEEDSRKGELVEELVIEALNEFKNRNLIRSFHFTDPHPRETDGLLLFEKSYWSIEIKSHPIFRKIPEDLDTALARSAEKTKEAIDQGTKAIEYLTDEGEEILYHLTGQKSVQENEHGIIVILDGLLPTLFSQNKQADELFGLSELYGQVTEDSRVYFITLFDLFELSNQIQEVDRFEEFLIWRTDYGFDMPVFAFNERDYWAMYFDNYSTDNELQEAVDNAAEDGILIPYISSRFNDKPHLPNDGFDDSI